MGHSNVRIAARRRKVASIAAMDKKYTTKNTTKSISPVVKHTLSYGNLDNAITCPFTGHKFVPRNPHKVPGKFGISITGYDWVEPEGLLWKYERHKQAKRLIKCKKHNDFAKFFPKYPYTLPKMNKVKYMEKLVEHKVEKWERKNPCPVKKDDTQQDLFEKEFLIPWENEKVSATERIRDFVISVYDKLTLTGRFEEKDKHGMKVYKEETLAEIKDIDGGGHNVNNLKQDSKLLKKVQDITNRVHSKRSNLICTNLRDHKKQHGRIILPQAA